MGHSIGVEQHYISRNVEEHRKKYADGYQYLRLGTPSPDEKLNLVEAVMKENAELKKKQMETEAELEKAKMTLSMMEGTLGTVTPDMVDWLKKQVKKQQLSEEQLKGEEKAQS
jgi:hypothetical protein